MQRRDFLWQLGAALATAACGGSRARPAPVTPAAAPAPVMRRPARGDRPRKLVQLYFGGGVDALYSFDPRTDRAIDRRMRIPYAARDIVEASGVKLAPFAAQLAPHVGRMVAINGVVGGTVSHEYGSVAIHHLGGPSAGETVASQIGRAVAPDAPFHEISFDRGGGEVLWQAPPGRSLYVGDQGELLRVLRMTAKQGDKTAALHTALAALAKTSAGDVRDIATRLDRWLATFPAADHPETDFYANATWRDGTTLASMRAEHAEAMRPMNRTLNEALFVLEHDLATSVFMSAMCSWDSHVENEPNQRLSLALSMPLLAAFLTELGRRKSRASGRLLSEETAVVVSSELGRFPIENDNAGKDHFPELPVLLFGPALHAGVYGATGPLMEGLPISLATGRADRTSSGTKPTIADVGATVFEWFDVAPPSPRDGRLLEFALAR